MENQVLGGHDTDKGITLSPLEEILIEYITIGPNDPPLNLNWRGLAEKLAGDERVIALGVSPKDLSRNSVNKMRGRAIQSFGIKGGTGYIREE